MQSPVAFIIFNRPDTTERVFSEIAKAKPVKLFVVADGPRQGRPADAEKCAEARAVIERVDWDCKVFKNYSDVNLGCGYRPASGISWVFEHVDRAIILEDDCVPHPTFFRFCDELLERYQDDERVMHIAGNNFQFGIQRTPFSYFFSDHNLCAGGWATWRRAWRHFDIGVKGWASLRETSFLTHIVEHPVAIAYWQEMFDRAYASGGTVNYWDYQWTLSCWEQNGLSILPNNTLISNIGFGHDDATHTRSANDKVAQLTAFLNLEEMIFPLKHPPYVRRNWEADKHLVENVVVGTRPQATPAGLLNRMRKKIGRRLLVNNTIRNFYQRIKKIGYVR
jgi:hypothetical protein